MNWVYYLLQKPAWLLIFVLDPNPMPLLLPTLKQEKGFTL